MASSSFPSAATHIGDPIATRTQLSPLSISSDDGGYNIWSDMLPTPDFILPTVPEKVVGGGGGDSHNDNILGSGICFDSPGDLGMDHITLSADNFSFLDELMSGVNHNNTPQVSNEGIASESFIPPADAFATRTPSAHQVSLPFPGPGHSSLPVGGEELPGPPPKPPAPTPQDEVQHGTSSCISHALKLLGRLFFAAPGDCNFHQPSGKDDGKQARNDGDYDGVQARLPTVDQVISNNEEIVKMLKSILECHCAQDGYLLHIISLTVFKVLGWYEVVALDKMPLPQPAGPHDNGKMGRKGCNGGSRQNSESDAAEATTGAICGARRVHPQVLLWTPAVIGAYRLDGEGRSRMAAQLVLSQLHRVQQLVKVLSKRVRERDFSETSPPSQLSPLPFSMSPLEQLEIDLRKYLRNMAAEIVDMLRRE